MRNTLENVIYPRERGADSADHAWKSPSGRPARLSPTKTSSASPRVATRRRAVVDGSSSPIENSENNQDSSTANGAEASTNEDGEGEVLIELKGW